MTLRREVLNTRLIRRVKWSDLYTQPLSTFVIVPTAGKSKDSIKTSEMETQDDVFFAKLDTRGYQPFAMFKENQGFRSGPIKVDDMTDAAMADKARANRPARPRRGRASGRGKPFERQGRR